jgi:hypothetical protein
MMLTTGYWFENDSLITSERRIGVDGVPLSHGLFGATSCPVSLLKMSCCRHRSIPKLRITMLPVRVCVLSVVVSDEAVKRRDKWVMTVRKRARVNTTNRAAPGIKTYRQCCMRRVLNVEFAFVRRVGAVAFGACVIVSPARGANDGMFGRRDRFTPASFAATTNAGFDPARSR